MDRRMRTAVFSAASVFLLTVGLFCMALTVTGKEQPSSREEEQYYLEKEKVLTADIRAYLQDKGYRDSGVMVTRVVNEDGSRDYTVTLHHRKLEALSEEAWEALLWELAACEFQEGGCCFHYKLL